MRPVRQGYAALRQRWLRWNNDRRILRMAEAVARQSAPQPVAPVVFFNSSTRITGLSLNASFSLLLSWALRLQGVPLIHFVCQAGMSRCILGSLNGAKTSPPCRACLAQSRVIYHRARVHALLPEKEPMQAELPGILDASLDQLAAYEYQGIPLGKLTLPGLRWVLRRHTLTSTESRDEEETRFLFREFIRSAYHLAQEFSRLLEQAQPQAVVIFNGQFFPEATARWVALQRGLRVITHEVGLQPDSAFFTDGEATAYPLPIPADFELSPEQDARLDAYLSSRFQGEFSMAGIRFWREIRGLPPAFTEKAAQFQQIVPVFTNVIFDTSQPHSNVVFAHMFAWLDRVLEAIRRHPETLFVIRAHPDENRPGKASRESVRDWVERNRVLALPNVLFYDSGDYFSSYQLIQRAKFSLIYNSTIGLEAAIMGKPVLCGGRARFTQLPTVFFPQTPEDFAAQLEEFLSAETIPTPPEFQRNARRFLYYQLFRSSLPFSQFIEPDGIWQGFVRLRQFEWQRLLPQSSPTIQVLLNGILSPERLSSPPFILPQEYEHLYD